MANKTKCEFKKGQTAFIIRENSVEKVKITDVMWMGTKKSNTFDDWTVTYRGVDTYIWEYKWLKNGGLFKKRSLAENKLIIILDKEILELQEKRKSITN